MKNCDPLRRRASALLLFTATLFFPATHHAQSADACKKPLPEYSAAVRDAETAEPREISKNLTAIVESNDKLEWGTQASCPHVLVASWIDTGAYDAAYKGKEGQFYTTDPCRYTWVTAAPEVREFCGGLGLKDEALTKRLEQRLGLKPCSKKTHFVELWVKPEDLFRPCPDPEISDQECGLSFPRSKYFSISLDYVLWFSDLRDSSYGAKGYPWTRLGYTYDWGNPKNPFGPSEFVIRPGSTVRIKGAPTTAEYCAGAGKS